MSFHKRLPLQAKLMIAEAIATSIAGLVHAGLGLSLSLSFVGLHLRFDRLCRSPKPTHQHLIKCSSKAAQVPVCPLLVTLYQIDVAPPRYRPPSEPSEQHGLEP